MSASSRTPRTMSSRKDPSRARASSRSSPWRQATWGGTEAQRVEALVVARQARAAPARQPVLVRRVSVNCRVCVWPTRSRCSRRLPRGSIAVGGAWSGCSFSVASHDPCTSSWKLVMRVRSQVAMKGCCAHRAGLNAVAPHWMVSAIGFTPGRFALRVRRNALAYVLQKRGKHVVSRRSDPYSSGSAFDGWSAHTRSTRRRRLLSVLERSMAPRARWKATRPHRSAPMSGERRRASTREHRGFDDGDMAPASRRAAGDRRARFRRSRSSAAQARSAMPPFVFRPGRGSDSPANLRRPRNRSRAVARTFGAASSRSISRLGSQPLHATCFTPFKSSLPVPSNGRRRLHERSAFGMNKFGQPISEPLEHAGILDSSSVSARGRSPFFSSGTASPRTLPSRLGRLAAARLDCRAAPISPPILLKRERRSVCEEAFVVEHGDVAGDYQPSRSTCDVRSGGEVAAHHGRPFTSSMRAAAGSGANVSGSTMRKLTPAAACRRCPRVEPVWWMPGLRTSGAHRDSRASIRSSRNLRSGRIPNVLDAIARRSAASRRRPRRCAAAELRGVQPAHVDRQERRCRSSR